MSISPQRYTSAAASSSTTSSTTTSGITTTPATGTTQPAGTTASVLDTKATVTNGLTDGLRQGPLLQPATAETSPLVRLLAGQEVTAGKKPDQAQLNREAALAHRQTSDFVAGSMVRHLGQLAFLKARPAEASGWTYQLLVHGRSASLEDKHGLRPRQLEAEDTVEGYCAYDVPASLGMPKVLREPVTGPAWTPPATWDEAQDMEFTDVTIMDLHIPATLLETALTDDGRPQVKVRLDGNVAGIASFLGMGVPPSGHFTTWMTLDDARPRPAPNAYPGFILLNPEEVAALAPGTPVLAGGVPAQLVSQQPMASDDEDEDEIVLGFINVQTLEFKQELHELHCPAPDDEVVGSGGRAPSDGLWKYRLPISEVDVRVMALPGDGKDTKVGPKAKGV